MSQRTAIMGFGNPVRSDDGIGCYVIDQLRPLLAEDPSISLFDMGTSAFEVLFQLKGHDRIIVIDAVINSGEPIGSLFLVPAEEIRGQIQEDPMVFLHSLKWDQALSYAKKIMGDAYPTDIQAYLIAVDNTRLEIGLAEEVQAAGDRLVRRLVKELKGELVP
jgi:hydrogenase maturation protease